MTKLEQQSKQMTFENRHIGIDQREEMLLLKEVGFASLQDLSKKIVPEDILDHELMDLAEPLAEPEALQVLALKMSKNKVKKSLIGMGYHGTHTPAPIGRLILENPGWYTQYTPYQAEISQGRLESLLNFQTMVMDLTGLPVANASLLDEATAASEFLSMAYSSKKRGDERVFAIDAGCHPQVIQVVKTRAKALQIAVKVFSGDEAPECFGCILAYPQTDGLVKDLTETVASLKKQGSMVAVACDLLGLTLLKSPGEMGADAAFGNSQRFGVPFGFGGPHAAFFSCKEEYKRKLPGRVVGVSKDAEGRLAYRLALQTREQHIRREKATSNICTAQALLANMAAMYAVYHGPEGIKAIANQVHQYTSILAASMTQGGVKLAHDCFFDTITVDGVNADDVLARALSCGINLRKMSASSVSVALDETVTSQDLENIAKAFGVTLDANGTKTYLPSELYRKTDILTHPVFNTHHSEAELTRYIKKLEQKDLSLCHSMIPLGSCTMKLNAVSELLPVSWPEIKNLHPFAPKDQSLGMEEMIEELCQDLATVTGFSKVSIQPNSGAQGELAGLLAIRNYHLSRGDSKREVCLIPSSAHGTNPASAVLVGFKVKIVKCDDQGNIDMEDFNSKLIQFKDEVAAVMVTYPSTHGVFEKTIKTMCSAVHEVGGQVYMDGANLNAQLGLCRPGKYGADVAHLNLHKTFCIPHGGGGPGVGPIGVAAHLESFLPSKPSAQMGEEDTNTGPVASAPYGSAGILPISWMYIRMMGAKALKRATQIAILNANYMAKRLSVGYSILYKSVEGHVAHECILDLRMFKKTAGIEVEDIAKRLMDYGFHAPTISWPVPGTMMVEPTESESKAELDRYCDALLSIREEIRKIEEGTFDKANNPLKNAPHTARRCTSDEWLFPYTRKEACFPADFVRENKFWPSVARVDNAHGDRNFVCSCPSLDSYE